MRLPRHDTFPCELDPPFVVHQPREIAVPLVFSSPHSGRVYPEGFVAASALDRSRLRKSEDAFVEELFSGVTDLGAPLIAARFPRAYLDVNREPYELDPELFADPLPAYANTRSLRVLGGLGTIARVVGESESIYRERLSLAEGLQRIERLYWPYHRALGQLLQSARERFGLAILIDCHSMPSSGAAGEGAARAHFVLGDRFGASCMSDLTRHVRSHLGELGYDVALNRPYSGGHITERYGAPAQGMHALQIEINRALFTNESTLTQTSGFALLRERLMQLVDGLARLSRRQMPMAAAAE